MNQRMTGRFTVAKQDYQCLRQIEVRNGNKRNILALRNQIHKSWCTNSTRKKIFSNEAALSLHINDDEQVIEHLSSRSFATIVFLLKEVTYRSFPFLFRF